MAKEALVVDREILFSENYFQGFISSEEKNFINIILNNYTYRPRGDDLENNSQLQQIVPYVWIVNPKIKQVFIYKRASNQNYSEKRLRNKWSCGIGGHIDREDSKDPIINAMMRELREEVLMLNYPKPKIVGYLKDDKTEVGKVHFGIVAIAETQNEVKKNDEEMVECFFMSIPEFESLLKNPENDIESWTRLSWPFVKNYLESMTKE